MNPYVKIYHLLEVYCYISFHLLLAALIVGYVALIVTFNKWTIDVDALFSLNHFELISKVFFIHLGLI